MSIEFSPVLKALGVEQFPDADILFGADFRGRGSYVLSDWPISVARETSPSGFPVFVWDAFLYLRTTQANLPRITNDKDTGVPLGLLVEEASTNLAKGTDHAGAAAGIALPTTWVSSFSGTGLTLSITQANASKITLRFQGDGSQSAANKTILWGAITDFPSANGSPMTVSANLKLIAGSMTGITVVPGFREYNSAQALQALNGGFTPVSIDGTDFIYEFTDTLAYDGYLQAGLFINYGASAFDCTIEISQEKVEARPYRTSYIQSAGSVVTTRGADVVTINNASSYLSRSAWSVEIEARAPQNTPNATLFQWDDGTSNNRLTAYLSGYMLKIDSTVGGVTTTTNFSYWVPICNGRLTMSIANNVMTASFNGTAVRTISVPLSLTRWLLGSGNAGAWNGTIANLSAWSQAYSAGSIALRARHGLYDDFARPDGPLGAAPTGQRYTPFVSLTTNDRTAMAVSGGRAVAPLSGQTGTYAYAGFDLGVPIKTIGVAFIAPVDGAKTLGTATMATLPSGIGDVTQITTGPATHAQIQSQATKVGYFANNSLADQPNGGGWYLGNSATVLTLTTGNVYFGSARQFGNFHLARGGDGRLVRGYNVGYPNTAARTGMFETSGTATTVVLPQILAVKADA